MQMIANGQRQVPCNQSNNAIKKHSGFRKSRLKEQWRLIPPQFDRIGYQNIEALSTPSTNKKPNVTCFEAAWTDLCSFKDFPPKKKRSNNDFKDHPNSIFLLLPICWQICHTGTKNTGCQKTQCLGLKPFHPHGALTAQKNHGWSTGTPPFRGPPLRNKGLIAGLIKGNQWVLGGRFVRGGRLTCHEKKSDESVRVAPPYSKDNEAKRNASKTQKSDSKSFYWGRVCSCLLISLCSLDLFWYLYVTTP